VTNIKDFGPENFRGFDMAKKAGKDDIVDAARYALIAHGTTRIDSMVRDYLRDPSYTIAMNEGLDRLTKSIKSAAAAAAAAADAINLSLVDLNVKKLSVVEYLRVMYAERKRMAEYEANQKRWRDDPLELKKRFLQPFINEQAVKLRSLGRTLINLSDRLQDKV